MFCFKFPEVISFSCSHLRFRTRAHHEEHEGHEEWNLPQCCIKKMEKISQIVMSLLFKADASLASESRQWCDPGYVQFSPSFLPFGKA
jgi:hypothetical protein